MKTDAIDKQNKRLLSPSVGTWQNTKVLNNIATECLTDNEKLEYNYTNALNTVIGKEWLDKCGPWKILERKDVHIDIKIPVNRAMSEDIIENQSKALEPLSINTSQEERENVSNSEYVEEKNLLINDNASSLVENIASLSNLKLSFQ